MPAFFTSSSAAHICSGDATIDDVIRHIDFYLELDGENTVCLGCDLDGAKLPSEICNITDLEKISNKMLQIGYSDAVINKIFWKNAKKFIENNIR